MLWVGFLPVLLAGSLLSAAKMPTPQSFRLPLAFEQNRGQAPAQVTWMGQGSSYRVLLGSDGATFLLPDKNDERAMAGRRPVPMDRSLRMKYSVMRMKLAGGRLPDGWERILARITSQYGDVYFVAVHSSLARSSLERLTSNGLFFSLAPRVAASRCPAYQNTSPNQVLQYVTVFTNGSTKLDPTRKVVFASYGGVGQGTGIAVDSTGVYVTGESFPADGVNIAPVFNNNGDAFVWRLEATGGLQNYFHDPFAN